MEGSCPVWTNVIVELGYIFLIKRKFFKVGKRFCHANNMAFSGLKKLFYLTISDNLSVLVLVYPAIFIDMYGRW